MNADFDSPCARRAQRAVDAITTLTHESMHLRGWLGEAEAQCYAIQEDPWTVVRLGGTEAEGAAVAQLVLAEQPAMPSDYQSGDCRAGGALDLHPETPAFPAEAAAKLMPAGLLRAGASPVDPFRTPRGPSSSARDGASRSRCSAASPPRSTACRSTSAPGG